MEIRLGGAVFNLKTVEGALEETGAAAVGGYRRPGGGSVRAALT